MPHKECLDLSRIIGYGRPDDQTLPPQPKPKPPLLTGPHLDESLLYPPGTEPYEFTD